MSIKSKMVSNVSRVLFCLKQQEFKSILNGDSLIAGLNRYCKIRNNFFKPIDALNCGIGEDKEQIVLWQTQTLPIYSSLKNVVIFCSINSLHQDSTEDIAGIIETGN